MSLIFAENELMNLCDSLRRMPSSRYKIFNSGMSDNINGE